MTYKNQGSIEVFVVLLDIAGVVLCHLPPVHHVEVKTRSSFLLGWKNVLSASWKLRPFSGVRSEQGKMLNGPLWVNSEQRAIVFTPLALPWVVTKDLM